MFTDFRWKPKKDKLIRISRWTAFNHAQDRGDGDNEEISVKRVCGILCKRVCNYSLLMDMACLVLLSWHGRTSRP